MIASRCQLRYIVELKPDKGLNKKPRLMARNFIFLIVFLLHFNELLLAGEKFPEG